jgi:3-hydroxybutyryl-CoA dehydratase
MPLKLSELNTAMDLPETSRQVTQEHIKLYAEASRDFNPIHLDVEFARKAGLKGTIAHGMLVLAYVSSYMTDNFGTDWLTGGGLNIRFKTPARPGDTIKIGGKITKLEKHDVYILASCNIFCRNQSGEDVILGDTKVRIKDYEDSN